MQSRFISSSKNNGRRSTARWLLVGLAFTLAMCLVAGFDLASKAQASPLLQIPTQSPTPSPTSTPLVISSADSETMPTWTSTPTPRRSTALAMTLQAQRDLTQTRLPPTPSSIYTLTRTPTITTTYFYKIFPSVTLRKWPTYTFTPRPTFTRIPTQDQRKTLESYHKTLTARAEYYAQFTATAEVGNYILVADVPDTGHKITPTVVWTATSKIKLGMNTTWLPDGSLLGSGLLFEGGLFDSRRLYTLKLTGGDPVRVDGQSDQLLAENPPKNNKDNIQPAISPDGKWIVFSSLAVDDRSRHHLFIMKADGSIIYQVTKGSYNQELQPTWAPDGKSIIFISVYYYSAQIYKLSVSWLTSGATSHKPVDMYGASPYIPDYYINTETAPRYCMDKDKPWVVFSKNIGSRQIYVMKADGNSGTNVTQFEEDHGNSFPDWSPDCNKIIFMQDSGETKAIDTLNIKWDSDTGLPSADGKPDRLISYDDGGLASPHYSPDGSQIVFVHTYIFVPTPIPTATSP